MLAILIGDFSLIVGLAILLLPLFLTELSRPRDGIWGAVVLLLGLVLVTCNERLRGAPMLAVLFGTLLIGRLGVEVAQSRWQHLSEEEKLRVGSLERWKTSFGELFRITVKVGDVLGEFIKLFNPKPKSNKKEKKWIRPEITNDKKLIQKVEQDASEASMKKKATNLDPSEELVEEQGASEDS